MHPTLRWTPCLLILALAFPAIGAPVPRPTKGPTVVLSAGTRYRVGEEVRFTRTVVNGGKQTLKVYPFRYINGHVRFHWKEAGSDKERRYGDGKDGFARPKSVPPGKSLTETLKDDIITQRQGTFSVYITVQLANGTRLKSNVIEIDVVDPDDD
jgi:hypothetical protein